MDVIEIGRRLAEDLKKNDHYTENPMFCFQILVRDIGYDLEYSNNRCWVNSFDEVIYDDDSDEKKDDLEFDESSVDWDGPFGYVDRWETIMVSFTQEGIDDYTKRNGHKVSRRAFRGETRVFVESFNGCEEMITIRNFLISFGIKSLEESNNNGTIH